MRPKWVDDRGGKGMQEMDVGRFVGVGTKYGDTFMDFDRFFSGFLSSGDTGRSFPGGCDWARLAKPIVSLRSLRVDGN